MSKPATETKAAETPASVNVQTLLKMTGDMAVSMSAISANVSELTSMVEKASTKAESDASILAITLEDIRSKLDQVLKASSGAKKQVKPTEEKSETVEKPEAVEKSPKPAAVKGSKGETEIAFYERKHLDPAFKVKYYDSLIARRPTSTKGFGWFIKDMKETNKPLYDEFKKEYNTCKNGAVVSHDEQTKDAL